jgi:hypothetical protein
VRTHRPRRAAGRHAVLRWDGKTDGGRPRRTATTRSRHRDRGGKAVTFDTLMQRDGAGRRADVRRGAMLQLHYGSQIAFAQVKQIH